MISKIYLRDSISRLINFQINSKLLLIFNFLLLSFIFDISKAETNNLTNSENNQIEIEYLESRNELEDYIIDTGDSISLEFFPADELSGVFPVNEEGELLLPRLDETYVRGLTTSELKSLLEKRYSEFLIDPDIKARVVVFKSIRVLARGELRNPGFYTFPAYQSSSFSSFNKKDFSELDSKIAQENIKLKMKVMYRQEIYKDRDFLTRLLLILEYF